MNSTEHDHTAVTGIISPKCQITDTVIKLRTQKRSLKNSIIKSELLQNELENSLSNPQQLGSNAEIKA